MLLSFEVLFPSDKLRLHLHFLIEHSPSTAARSMEMNRSNSSNICTSLSIDLLLQVSFFENNNKIAGSSCIRFSKDHLLNHLRSFNIPSTSKFLDDFERNKDVRSRFAKHIHFTGRQEHLYDPSQSVSFPFPRANYGVLRWIMPQHY